MGRLAHRMRGFQARVYPCLLRMKSAVLKKFSSNLARIDSSIPTSSIASTMQDVARTRNATIRLQPGDTEEINAAVNSINALLEANQQSAFIAEKLGDGDLTVRAEPVSDQDTMGLAQKRMVSNLTELISEIAMVSESLSDGAEGVSSASEALSDQTTGEAASVQQISGSLAEIANRAKSNADNSEAMRILSSEARNAAAAPISSGLPTLPLGILLNTASPISLSSLVPLLISVSIAPGAIALTLIPLGPRSRAKFSVRPITPPFEAVYASI